MCDFDKIGFLGYFFAGRRLADARLLGISDAMPRGALVTNVGAGLAPYSHER